MKTIHSPVARPDLDRLSWIACGKASELAKNKRIVRKQERAMLKHHLGRDIQNELVAMDEDAKQIRIACELT